MCAGQALIRTSAIDSFAGVGDGVAVDLRRKSFTPSAGCIPTSHTHGCCEY